MVPVDSVTQTVSVMSAIVNDRWSTVIPSSTMGESSKAFNLETASVNGTGEIVYFRAHWKLCQQVLNGIILCVSLATLMLCDTVACMGYAHLLNRKYAHKNECLTLIVRNVSTVYYSTYCMKAVIVSKKNIEKCFYTLKKNLNTAWATNFLFFLNSAITVFCH